MTSIEDDDTALDSQLTALEAAVQKVRDEEDLTKKRKEERTARALLNTVKADAHKFRSSVQKLDDPTQRSVFNRKYNSYDDKLKGYDKELRNLITAPRKNASRKGGKQTVTFEEKKMEEIMGEGGRSGLGFETAKQVMQAANRAQDDTQKSLTRSLKLGHTMRDQTHEMLETLSKQTEKLYQVDKELADLDGELDRAKTDVLWFFRQMASDWCCLGLMIFLLLGVLGLIFWKIFSKRFPQSRFAIHTTVAPATSTLAPGETTPAPCTFDWLCG